MNKTISLFMLLVCATAFGAASSSDPGSLLNGGDKIDVALARLSRAGCVNIDMNLAFELEQIIDEFPAEMIEDVLKVLLKLCEDDKVLSCDRLNRAIQLVAINSKYASKKAATEMVSLVPSEGRSRTWEYSKAFVSAASITFVSSYALTKAIQYCLAHKNDINHFCEIIRRSTI